MSLRLDGRLAGPWVEELRASCRRASNRRQRCAAIDLTGVTYIDADGKALLTLLWRQGAELRASGCLTRCVVEEITRLKYDPGSRNHGKDGVEGDET
jgi:ABC-type transporter Mla MlaB component